MGSLYSPWNWRRIRWIRITKVICHKSVLSCCPDVPYFRCWDKILTGRKGWELSTPADKILSKLLHCSIRCTITSWPKKEAICRLRRYAHLLLRIHDASWVSISRSPLVPSGWTSVFLSIGMQFFKMGGWWKQDAMSSCIEASLSMNSQRIWRKWREMTRSWDSQSIKAKSFSVLVSQRLQDSSDMLEGSRHLSHSSSGKWLFLHI